MEQEERGPVPLWRALGGVLANPTATFAAFPAKQPWFVPLLLFGVIGAVGGWVIASATADVVLTRIEELSGPAGNPMGDPSAVASFAGTVMMVTATASGFFGPFLDVLMTAVVTWIVAAVARAVLPFAQLFSLAAYAYLPHVFGTVLLAVLVASGLFDPLAMRGVFPTSLAVVVPGEPGSFLAGLFGRVELFTLWSTVLLGIGLGAAARRGARWGIGVAVAGWLLMAVVSAGLGSLVPNPGTLPPAPGGVPGSGVPQ
ncbi:hypothetical protein Tmar_1993 [Thermaerobacter marianensis DSM 12885]|uniref:Yip1 domain-containing protein n=1 Tax=Thermaerobacter marianensis (strain ATCC 700841 / DSM 12885 / JCM 10246 / 7p75a) TaxID=644966 RepID=E6SJ51_THEM7|nr:YIP1 family protein [Thermaerobacter marianensis]ADU52075.1 hypothetical protein Tmar_1993 [Thermaerobacter marianensis DSM 12885]